MARPQTEEFVSNSCATCCLQPLQLPVRNHPPIIFTFTLSMEEGRTKTVAIYEGGFRLSAALQSRPQHTDAVSTAMTAKTATTTHSYPSPISSSTDVEDTPKMRLPPYFPTSVKECSEPTNTFFTCFERHAVMQHSQDTISAKRSLLSCQSELHSYTTCMDQHIAKKDQKPWWKFI